MARSTVVCQIIGTYTLTRIEQRQTKSGYRTRGFSWHDSNFLVTARILHTFGLAAIH
jgi:hypothetical protein